MMQAVGGFLSRYWLTSDARMMSTKAEFAFCFALSAESQMASARG